MAVEESESRRLVDYTRRSLESEEDFHFLRFESLHRLNIVRIGMDLIHMKSRMNREGELNKEDMEALSLKLRDYSTAVRGYMDLRNKRSVPKREARKRKLLMQRYFQSDNDFGDPFSSHYHYFEPASGRVDPLRHFLMRYLPAFLTFSSNEKEERAKEYQEGQPPKEISVFVDRLARLLIALAGGAFLIVPMVVMTLGQGQVHNLVTASVAVVLFALVLAFAVRVSNAETLIATATYAAVLVVFVGTSSPSPTS